MARSLKDAPSRLGQLHTRTFHTHRPTAACHTLLVSREHSAHGKVTIHIFFGRVLGPAAVYLARYVESTPQQQNDCNHKVVYDSTAHKASPGPSPGSTYALQA